MRTATTLYLVAGAWTVGAGPDGHGAKNAVPIDVQRAAQFNPDGWPKDATACLFQSSDGEYRLTQKQDSKFVTDSLAAAIKKAEAKQELAHKRDADNAEKAAKEAQEKAKAAATQRAAEVKAKEDRKKAAAAAVIPISSHKK